MSGGSISRALAALWGGNSACAPIHAGDEWDSSVDKFWKGGITQQPGGYQACPLCGGLLPDSSRKRRVVWALIFGLLLLSIGLAVLNAAQDGTFAILAGTGTVTGAVYDELGNPVVAEIFIFRTNISTYSDQTGYFKLEGVPAGQQVVLVAYRKVGREYPVEVVAGQTTEMAAAHFIASDFMNGWSQLSEDAP
jgi:hypothetical protein